MSEKANGKPCQSIDNWPRSLYLTAVVMICSKHDGKMKSALWLGNEVVEPKQTFKNIMIVLSP